MTSARAIVCGVQESEVHMQAELNAAHSQANALQAQLNQHVAASQTSETAAAAERASTRERLQHAHSQVLVSVIVLLKRKCYPSPPGWRTPSLLASWHIQAAHAEAFIPFSF